MRLTPKKWEEFQHYKDRSPAWIKLHRALLDDYAFSCLPVASRALAPMLWLLASESKDGSIEATYAELAFRLRMKEREVEEAVKPLIDAKFFTLEQDASNTLADRKHDACLEEEKRKRREETDTVDADFEKFKKEYPKRGASNPWQPALLLFRKAVKDGHDPTAIIAAATSYRHECEKNNIVNTDKVAQAQTWFRQERWRDYKPTAPVETIPGEFLVKRYSQDQTWRAEYGPEPGKPGCRASPEVLAKFGFVKGEAA